MNTRPFQIGDYVIGSSNDILGLEGRILSLPSPNHSFGLLEIITTNDYYADCEEETVEFLLSEIDLNNPPIDFIVSNDAMKVLLLSGGGVV